MNGAGNYRILDEPQPGGLSSIAVSPVWPLFAYMFGGAWFAWMWFAINGFAIGSPTRFRELSFACIGFLGVIAIAVLLGCMKAAELLPQEMIVYGLLVVTLWKLGICYWLYALQNRSFTLYQYFGGTVRSGIAVVIVGYLLGPAVIKLSTNGLWRLLVS